MTKSIRNLKERDICMKSFDVIIVSVAVAIMTLVIGLVSGAQIASNSVEVHRDGDCVYVYVLGEPQVYYID